MNPNPQPNLPFSAGAIDWLAGIECRASQLGVAMTKAERAGFKAIRVQIIGGRYRVEFERQHETPSACDSAPQAKHGGTAGIVASHQAERGALSLDTPREVVGNR